MAARDSRHARYRNSVRLEGVAKQGLEVARNRLVIAAALFSLIFLAIAGRVVDLTVFKHRQEPQAYARAADGAEDIARGRANIVDRNGVLLATSVRTASLYADPGRILDAREAAQKLAHIFPDLQAGEIHKRLSMQRRFVWIRRHLTPREQAQVNALGIPGVYFEKDSRRVYPFGPLLAHVVGYTDIDDSGLAGVEKYFDNTLRSQQESLRMTIDVKVQHALRDELLAAMRKHKAAGAVGLVSDVNTGEIVAMVSLPDFDPNNINEANDDQLFNRASLGAYEMGSTFKIFNTALALESQTASFTSRYDASQPIKVAGGYTINDFKPKNSWLSVSEIFMYSSNIGSAKMALDVGTAKQQEFLKKLGLLYPATIELAEVASPIVPAHWREVNTMTIAFGHGIAVSPVQLVAAVGAVVNGGELRPATLLYHSGAAPADGHKVISRATSEKMRQLLRLVVERGSGTKAQMEGYLIGGKTGSAEKSGGHGYRKTSLLSSFVGVFPIQEPRYVVLAMLDEPQATADTYGYATGGWVAAPVVARVVERIAPLLGIAPVHGEDEAVVLQQLTIPQAQIHPEVQRAAF